MRGEDAVRFARENITMSNGDIVFIQSNGQIQHPHSHRKSDLTQYHTDGWAVKKEYGDYYAAKIHSDDYYTNTEPSFSRYY